MKLNEKEEMRVTFSLFFPLQFSLLDSVSLARVALGFLFPQPEILNFQLVFFQLSGSMNSALALRLPLNFIALKKHLVLFLRAAAAPAITRISISRLPLGQRAAAATDVARHTARRADKSAAAMTFPSEIKKY